MEDFKSEFKSKIKIITSHPIFGVFLLLIIVLWGVVYAAAPNAPSNLLLDLNQTGADSTHLVFDWTDNSTDEDSFNLESQISGGDWTTVQINNLGPNMTSTNLPIITPSLPRDYRIKACLAGTCSGPSNVLTGIFIGPPSTPTGLTLDTGNTTTSTIAFTWTNETTNETKFNIFRKLSTDSTFSGTSHETISVADSFPSYIDDNNVTPGVLYDYRIESCQSGSGCSLPSAPLSGVSTVGSVPNPPTSISLGTTTTTTITINWTNNTTDIRDKFNVERKLSTSVDWTGSIKVLLTGPNITSYTDSTVTSGVTYDYRVQSCLAGNCSVEYATLTGVSAAGGTTVNMPTGFVVSTTLTSTMTYIPLHWIDNSNNETQFVIERKLSTDTTYAPIFTSGPNIIAYTDNAVTKGVSYDYRIKACVSSTVCSSYFDLTGISIPTSSGGGGGTTIYAPTDFATSPTTLTSSMTGVPLVWTDNSNNETQFTIERKLSTATVYTILYITPAPNVTAYMDNSVARGISYDYRIEACISSTVCSNYAYLPGVVLPAAGGTTTTPLAPTNLTYTVSGSNITLNWIDNSNNEAGFKIYRGPTWTDIGNVGPNVTTFTDSNRPVGTYTYHLNAFNSSYMYSPITNDVSVTVSATGGTTTSTTPLAPTNFMLNGTTATTISLKWTDNATNEDRYTISRKLSSANWNDVASVTSNILSPNVTSYVDTTIATGISYDYRVIACIIAVGCSEPASLVGIIVSTSGGTVTSTIPLAPTNLYLDNIIIPGKISLTWVDNSNNEDKFSIEKKLSTATVWSYLSQIGTNNIHYVDSAVTFGISYDYRVQACLSGTGCSTYAVLTGVVSTNTTTPTTTPLAPTNLTATVSRSNITLNWIDNSNNEAGFKIYRGPVWTDIGNVGPNVTTFTDSNRPVGTYTYRLNAFNSSYMYSPISNDVSATVSTTGAASNQTTPTNPTTPIIVPPTTQTTTTTAPTPASTTTTSPTADTTTASTSGTSTDTTADAVVRAQEISVKDITEIISTISGPSTDNQPNVLNEQAINLIYKDTNNDGISDYDSVHIYNMDPEKPSPVSTYEGKEIDASEKVMLGFDPTKTELVKVEKELPTESGAATTTSYKVEEIRLTDNKGIILKGQALPNSFITIYIYSTPIMVTVKTDNNGEWQYVLDKELENGEHTIYAASVNNTGNIIAKSPGYVFTKTAEAVTLNDLPVVEANNSSEKPGFLAEINIYLAISIFLIIIIGVLILTGVISKKSNQN